MKKLVITSLLAILTLPVFAEDAPNPFTDAKTADEAWNIFETESQNILDKYKSQLHNKEYKKLSDLRTELLGKKPAAQQSDKNATEKEQKGKTKKELTEEEKEKKVKELRENADAMKKKEQSTANKLLGAAGIGATGIGGMQLASAMSEQQADNDAEQAMKAYLATFKCEYGDKHVAGGEMDVELPGGNELISLYSEYVTLANDLKVRKTALGIKPGIESETILDSATSGLYDDVGVEKTSGAYASLARALQNPDGEDAKLWAAQKEETANKLKTGAITAGVGAAGSLVANLAINAKAPKEKSASIKKKYSKLQDKFEKIEKEIKKQPTPKCSDIQGATGTWPQCTCAATNTYWDTNQGKCITCANTEIVQDNKCVPKSCNLTDGFIKEGECACLDTAKPNGNKCECKLTGAVDTNSCTCASNATQSGDKCECTGTLEEKTENGVTTCVEKAIKNAEVIANINIPGDTSFDFGKSDVKDDKKAAMIGQIWPALEQAATESDTTVTDLLKETCITIDGHTDYYGQPAYNKKLSKERAETVKQILIEKSDNVLTNDNFKINAHGPAYCDETKYNTAQKRAECRKVDVKIITGACDGSVPAILESVSDSLGVKVGSIPGAE